MGFLLPQDGDGVGALAGHSNPLQVGHTKRLTGSWCASSLMQQWRFSWAVAEAGSVADLRC
jgi:hypothetical protein